MPIQTEIRTGVCGRPAKPQRDKPPICDRPFFDTTKIAGFTNSYFSDTEVYGEKEQANYLYKVESGAVRTYRILENGRRQIAAFYVRGDVFGFETGDQHTLSAETTDQSKLLLINRSMLVALAARDNNVASQLCTLAAFELRRGQDHVLLFSKPALERIAGFLVEMAQRLSANGEVELPMKRQDIADYLVLTIETVSRSLAHLENISAVKLQTRRRIVLRNYSALVRLSA